MEYTTLQGNSSSAEPWSPGPKYQTIWALDNGEPVVIDVRNNTQVEYEIPKGVPARPNPEAVDRAYDVLHREWVTRNIYGLDWYGRMIVARYADHTVERPTEKEVAAAHFVIGWSREYEHLSSVYREAHTARKPLADKRFYALWES